MTPAPRRKTFVPRRRLLLLPLLAMGTGACLTPDAYHRDRQDAGATGGSATGGSAGAGGVLETGGVSGGGGRGTGGVLGTGGARANGGTVGSTGGSTGGATGSGATNGATLLNDDFESGAGQWITSGPGTATVKTDGSTVYDLAEPMSKVFLAAGGDVAWTNVTVQARVKIVSWAGSSSSDYAGICGRLADADDYTCITLRGDGKVALRENVGGSGSSVGSSVTANLVAGTWYQVALTIDGGSVTASVNGMMLLPKTGDLAAAPGSPAGGVALVVANAEAEFDDVKVTVP
ncbi:MAG TPA: hypothetical protein VHO67_20495 [Polyangia bacterium]|nr:hypothetical protein [Polyangia bacterium]